MSNTTTATTKKKDTVVIDGVALPQLDGQPDSWRDSSFLSVRQIANGGLALLLQRSQQMRTYVQQQQQTRHQLRLKLPKPTLLMGTIFLEASTRTACSFQAAMIRLGGHFLHVDGSSSSRKKGESLSDTVRCLECYTDLSVIRHYQKGELIQNVVPHITKPIINAGDGIGEHPTQALLDIFTIYDELRIDPDNLSQLSMVFLGDLKHGRTVHSLISLLANSQDIVWKDRLVIKLCAPPSLELPNEILSPISDLIEKKIVQIEMVKSWTPQELLPDAHVLYVTRIQRERFASEADYETVQGSYVVTADMLQQHAPAHLKVLHPLPRVDEIATDVDADLPRAAYFRQMENGMYVRMALLALILGIRVVKDKDDALDDNGN